MGIIRCENGHYYDDTKFAQCPHCGVLPIMNENVEQKQEKKPKRFSFFRKVDKVVPPADEYEEDDDRTVALDEDDDRTVALADDDDRTMAFFEDDDRTVALEDDDRTIALEDDNQTIAFREKPAFFEDDDRTVALEEDDRTVALEDDNQTEKIPETSMDYIAGWIVCTAGADKGKDFRLYQGFNRIALQKRGVRIVLQTKESDEVAGAIVYDDNSNRFFVMPQQTEISLNGVFVTDAKEIQSGDEIAVAGEKFIFVAFCGEGRRWDAENQ